MQEYLTQQQLDGETKKLCQWAAARAGAIVVAPVVGSMALVANEAYMISRIATLHGKTLSDGTLIGFMGGFAGAVAGQTLATLIPFPPTQIPIAMGITYALGIAAHEWMKAGCPSDLSAFDKVFADAKKEANDLLTTFKTHPQKDVPLGDESKTFPLK